MTFHRIDNILTVKTLGTEDRAQWYHDLSKRIGQNLWGVSLKKDAGLDHIELTLHVEEGEFYIVDRLDREKRCGTVERVDNHMVRFTADVHDASEMLPWLRTFTGRIVELTCTDPTIAETFYEDLNALSQMYGGEAHVS